MRQADIFLESEGDAWLERNRDQLGHSDPVADVIEHLGLKPTRVFEIGCANGWRLAGLRAQYGCEVYGVDPSMQAGLEAAEKKVPVWQMTASTLPIFDKPFDLVIYGFCLYLTDPSDWFNIAAEGDRALAAGGHLIIHDFGDRGKPFARKYEHREGVLAYHIDFAKLWLGHPLYHSIGRELHNGEQMITVLKKSPANIIEVVP